MKAINEGESFKPDFTFNTLLKYFMQILNVLSSRCIKIIEQDLLKALITPCSEHRELETHSWVVIPVRA